jgi:hypothetical protein
MIIASCLALPIMQTYLQLDEEQSQLELDNTSSPVGHFHLTEKHVVKAAANVCGVMVT